MIKLKLVSSLEKVLLNSDFESYKELRSVSALRGERLSFQIIHTYVYKKDEKHWDSRKTYAALTASGALSEHATFRDVCNIAIDRPSLHVAADDTDYISKEPGLFPDVLRPLHYKNKVTCTADSLFSVWVEINIPKDATAGKSSFTVVLDDGNGEHAEASLDIEIVPAELPEESIYFAQWFHADCLATHYDVDVWSEKHWKIVENFARVAAKNGINLLLTPLLTPPLDTDIGGERLTTQLVSVTRTNGKYSFDFSLLDRWIDMCDRVGIKYFEINHLFTQWGAEHAPKVMATVDGEYKRIFGWDTDAIYGKEYAEFLRALLSEFIAHMKKRGDDKRCFFHISDEPSAEHLEHYKDAKAIVADLLSDYTIMDAISNYDFWKLGVLETPIPSNNHIAPFIEGKVPNLWTYYCCSQQSHVSNRFIQMPSRRNRSIGFQMYKYNIVGFLHWGYNFYSNYLSSDPIDPYLQQDGCGWVPPGDAFSVYPAHGGAVYESLRIIVFNEALQDMKAMKLAEKFYGKEKIVALIDEYIGTDVTFDTCAKTDEALLMLREKINLMIREALN